MFTSKPFWHTPGEKFWYFDTPWRRFVLRITDNKLRAKIEHERIWTELQKANALIWKQIHQRTKELGLKNLATWNKEGKLLPEVPLNYGLKREGGSPNFMDLPAIDSTERDLIDVEQYLRDNPEPTPFD